MSGQIDCKFRIYKITTLKTEDSFKPYRRFLLNKIMKVINNSDVVRIILIFILDTRSGDNFKYVFVFPRHIEIP